MKMCLNGTFLICKLFMKNKITNDVNLDISIFLAKKNETEFSQKFLAKNKYTKRNWQQLTYIIIFKIKIDVKRWNLKLLKLYMHISH